MDLELAIAWQRPRTRTKEHDTIVRTGWFILRTCCLLSVLLTSVYADDTETDDLVVNQDGTTYGKFWVKGPATTDDMVAYYSFATNATPIQDESGNSNTGVVNGAAWTNAGIVDGAYWFDGSNDLINVDSLIDDVTNNQSGSISAWVRPTDSTARGDLMCIGDSNASTFLRLRQPPANGRFTAQIGNAGITQWQFITDTVVHANDVWVHVVLVHDGTEPSIYIDGQSTGVTWQITADKTAWIGDVPGFDTARLGCADFNGSGDSQFWAGTMDEVRIYSVALSADDVLKLYLAAVNPDKAGKVRFDKGATYVGALGDVSMGSYTNE